MNVSQCSAGMFSSGVNGYNQLTNTGYSYDAAGNMTGDGVYTYTFDAENRIISSSGGVNYTYDGNGLRVEKSNGTLYWRSLAGDTLAETDLSGNTIAEYVFFAGRRVDRLNSNGSPYFYYTDPLGNTRTMTDASGNLCYDADFSPYGAEINHLNSCPQNYKFTGYERDPETGLDYAFARYYNSALGRFMSTDPLGGSIGDPQSLNLYPYVANRTLSSTDPTGMCGQVFDNGSRGCNGGAFFGYGGMTCTVDGVSFDCGDAFRLLDLGQAAVCPRNNCTGATFNANGLYLLTYHEPTYSNTTECSPDPNDPDADWQCSGKISLTMGGWSSDYVGGNSGNTSDVHGQAYYFFKDFSLFGPKNDPRPSCFAAFLKELPANFFGYSGADITGGVATATYILTPPSPVPPTMALRGGKYALNWIKADNAARAANATGAGLAANLVFAEALALGNEIDSALNGNCK